MLGRLYDNQDCSAARTLELIGERWSLLILRDAMFRNYTHFSQFQKSLGIATNILAKRLESFVAAGIMEQSQPGASGERTEYLLTQKGLELKPVIIALTEWGDKWVQPGLSYSNISPTASLSSCNCGASATTLRSPLARSSPTGADRHLPWS
jgi:DNA-binding HxlR family transcriptional regulator